MNQAGTATTQAPARKPQILLVDDDESIVVLMQLYLEDLADIYVTREGLTALKRAIELQPDLILLDARLPDIDGLDVCKSLMQNVHTKHIPVIFLTGTTDQEFEKKVFETGAADYLQKPITPERVLMRVQVHLRAKLLADQLREQAHTDSLTGLLNRRLFNKHLDEEWRRAKRYGGSVEFFLVDIDHFKAINDQYGHSVGDQCLGLIAEKLQSLNERASDHVYRVGGEEFAVINSSIERCSLEEQAQRLVERLCIREWPSSMKKHPPELTVSIGAVRLAFGPNAAEGQYMLKGPEQLYNLADTLLYEAKDAGRNTYRCVSAKAPQ